MGMFCHKSFKEKASLILAFFVMICLYGQEKEQYVAESIFEKYHKFELFAGYGILYTTNEENAADYKYSNLKAFNLGVDYNFFQIHNFNFKIGFIWRIYQIKSSRMFRHQDTGLLYDTGAIVWLGDFNQYIFPLTAEYFIAINKNLSLNFGLGTEFLIYPEDSISGVFFVAGNKGKWIGSTNMGNSKDGFLYIGLNASVGLNIEAGPLLLRPSFTYHYQPETLFTNVVTTQNLLVSENTVSTHKITGNYIMFGLGISLNREVFRKNGKKAEK